MHMVVNKYYTSDRRHSCSGLDALANTPCCAQRCYVLRSTPYAAVGSSSTVLQCWPPFVAAEQLTVRWLLELE